MMTRARSFMWPMLALSAISSTNFTSVINYTVSGVVCDEHGAPVGDADVLIESAMDRRHTISSTDGSFFSDIYIGGAFDEIYIKALYGMKAGAEKICAHGSHISVDIRIRDIKK